MGLRFGQHAWTTFFWLSTQVEKDCSEYPVATYISNMEEEERQVRQLQVQLSWIRAQRVLSHELLKETDEKMIHRKSPL